MNEYEKLLGLDNTPRQNELLMALMKHDNVKKAAEATNMSERGAYRMLSMIRKRQTAIGEGSHFIAMNNLKDTGLTVKGTSTLYKDGEPTIQWVKTDREAEDKLTAMREAVADIVSEVYGKAKKTKAPKILDKDQMTVYNIGDAHIGMLAHHSESGDDFDLNIAEADLIEAMKRLVKASPASETAIIVDVGDFFHADNQANETSASKNKLDVDGRWFKVLRVGLMIMVKLIEEALKKHNKIIVKNAIGNHNEHSAIYLSLFLASWFRNEPRVKVDESPCMFWYHQFGKVLLGVTHGHTVKPQDLGEIMAADCEEIWSESKYRYWYTGHVHHDQVKEFRTHKFESFRTLAGKDAWHASSGYRSGRDMKCIVHHKDYGEIQRHTVNLAMLRDVK